VVWQLLRKHARGYHLAQAVDLFLQDLDPSAALAVPPWLTVILPYGIAANPTLAGIVNLLHISKLK
jgi:hypothetical protein